MKDTFLLFKWPYLQFKESLWSKKRTSDRTVYRVSYYSICFIVVIVNQAHNGMVLNFRQENGLVQTKSFFSFFFSFSPPAILNDQ